LQGGRFGHGFVSAGLSAVINPAIAEHVHGFVAGGIAASISMGTISAVTGGKFANGAITAAFEYSFSSLIESDQARNEGNDEPSDLNEPSNWSFRKNGDWAGKIHEQTQNGVTAINIGITVAAEAGISSSVLEESIHSIESNWSGNYMFGENRYSLHVALIPVIGKADLYIQPSNTGYHWGLVGGDKIGLVLGRYNQQTAAHEFGHNLGFGHNYNFTHQIMSYCFGCRAVQSEEVSRLANEYQ